MTERDRRAYFRARAKTLRDNWLKENGPCKGCGSWDDLEVDHIDATAKVTNRIWGWGQAKREAELAKCQPLCKTCHKEKTRLQRRSHIKHGTKSMYRLGCKCAPCLEAGRAAWRATHTPEMRRARYLRTGH